MNGELKHLPEDVPKSCWTCIHGTGRFDASGGMCDLTKELKANIEPCKEWRLNTIWLYSDWFWPPKEARKMKATKKRFLRVP